MSTSSGYDKVNVSNQVSDPSGDFKIANHKQFFIANNKFSPIIKEFKFAYD